MANLTSLEHTAIGALCGTIEVCVFQPTVAVKNALQEGRAIPRTPVGLYRGLTVNASSMAPITAMQFGAYRAAEQLLHRMTGEEVSQGGKIAVAAFAGGCSAFISSPAELVMIQQQSKGGALGETAKRLLAERGALGMYRGLSMTLARESLYVAGYLGICPVLHDWLTQQPWIGDYPASTPTMISGITGGVFAAIASQPADTAKTRMQAFIDPVKQPEYLTASSTLRTVIKEGGFLNLWAGFAPRAFRVIGAAFLLNATRKKAIDVVQQHKGLEAES